MYKADENRPSVSPDEVSLGVADDGGVACPLVGHVTLDRCRECVYLLRLEGASARDSVAGYAVCADYDPDPSVDFAW